jgi:diguanylate cyclase (GGDEF)-like protein/PAS domain S-box-containing protein
MSPAGPGRAPCEQPTSVDGAIVARALRALGAASPDAAEEGAVAAIGILGAHVGADRGALLLAGGATGALVHRLAWTREGEVDPGPLPLPMLVWLSEQLAAGRTVCLDRRDEGDGPSARTRELLSAIDITALLAVPVLDGSRLVAVAKLAARGAVRWADGTEAALRTIADATSRAIAGSRLERDLDAAGGHLSYLVDASPVAMWRLHRDSDALAYLTPNSERMLGWPIPEQLRRWAELVHPEDRGAVDAALARVRSGRDAAYEARFRHRDGRWVTLDVVVRAEIDEEGRPAGAVGYSIDVTDRRGAEDRLRQSQKLEAVGQLAGGVAHDFNNLLTVMRGYIELAQQGDAAALGEALAAAERARAVVEWLLTFSRQRPAETSAIDLNAMLASMRGMLALLGADLVLRLHLGEGLGAIAADIGLVEQAVLNLVVNARDAMPGGGTVTLRTDVPAAAEVPTELRGLDLVRLSVADTGCGMPPEVAARALEPFFTTKEEGRGTGLGLAAVYGAVTAAGGAVRFDTEPGVGTTFELFWPTTTGAAPLAPAPVRTPGALSGTVLLVEDQPQIGELVRRALEQVGCDVVVAADGAAAVGLAEREAPDLLLTDVMMPGMDGPQVAAAIRLHRPDLSVLFMSGYSAEAVPLDDRTAFLQKPFTLTELVDAVGAALARGRTDGAAAPIRTVDAGDAGDAGVTEPAVDPLPMVRDPGRLAAVAASGLVDTPPDPAFDRLAALACRLLSTPFAFVTAVDETRSWYKSAIGLAEDAPRWGTVEASFCRYVVATGEELLVGDAREDDRTAGNPAIASMGVVAWAGFPLRAPGGEVLGSFCVVDVAPREWTAEDRAALVTLAEAASAEVALRAALRHERTQRRRAETACSELERQATHDDLTTLPNRRLLEERVTRCLRGRARAADRSHAVVRIALDGLRAVGDAHGRAAADAVLRAAALRIRAATRPGDTTARIADDELAVLVEDVADRAAVLDAARLLLAALHDPFPLPEGGIALTASVGVAHLAEVADAEEALRDAGLALRRARSLGPGAVVTCTSSLRADAERHARLRTAVEGALGRDEVAVHLQPIVDLATSRVVGAEALLRWTHPALGAVPAEELVALAEEAGVMHDIGAHVLHAACAWLAATGADLTVAVNLSGAQLAHPDLPAQVGRALAAADVPGRSLVLEVGESALGDPVATAALAAVKRLGVTVAIDDFGTGSTSLAHLDGLVDALKIDRSFVAGTDGDDPALRLPAAVLRLARSFGVAVVAEGVETVEQRDVLRALGCERAQGHLFSRAVPPEAAARLLDGPLGVTPPG